MTPNKEMMVQVGFWATLFVAITTFWWKLSSRFARKDLVKIQFESITATVEDTKAEVSKLWGVVTDISSDTSETKGMIKGMCDNRKKRKGD